MRNGYKERHLTTEVKTLTLRVPQIRDGIVIKTKEGEQVRSFSAPLATGVNQEGYREILEMELGNSETEESWSNFFKDLKARGLKGVNVVISDNL
jgi:putative transposase